MNLLLFLYNPRWKRGKYRSTCSILEPAMAGCSPPSALGRAQMGYITYQSQCTTLTWLYRKKNDPKVLRYAMTTGERGHIQGYPNTHTVARLHKCELASGVIHEMC